MTHRTVKLEGKCCCVTNLCKDQFYGGIRATGRVQSGCSVFWFEDLTSKDDETTG